MANFFGIDFGTTNSAVVSIAEVDGERISVLNIGEERRPLPSFVAIHKETGEVRTGSEAKNSISDSDEYEIFPSIKSIIDKDCEWIIAGKTWTQIDIAAELFKALKKNTEQRAKMKLHNAVVAVPVGFSAVKRENVREAARKAGINISMFITEPTAAYCCRKNKMKKYKNIAVFDWGGGTLDVEVLHIDGGLVREMASEGLSLAGNDIDRILADRICQRMSLKTGKDFSFHDLSPNFQLRLLEKCEEAKCNLADDDIVTIAIPNFDGYGRCLENIQYDYFSLLIEKEVNQAVACLKKALDEAGMNKESIDCILCEGGSSRLRPLQEKLLSMFDHDKVVFSKQAMWDIGGGAAEVAVKPGCYALNRPIGVMLSNNIFYPLLNVGQRIPTEEKKVTFGVVEAGEQARFIITDGENEASQTFTEYFPVKLRGFDDEVIKVSCYIDADMIFRMKIESNRMPDNDFRVWTYSKLQVAYDSDAPEPEQKQI